MGPRGTHLSSGALRAHRPWRSESSAERLARDPKPTFICVLRLNAWGEFADMHLIHHVLGAVLRRLREETARGSKNLNRKEITFAISAGRNVEIAPTALRAALEEDIGEDMHLYSRRKEQQLKDLGYDAHRILLKMEFPPLKPDQIVDGFLGLEDLPLNTFYSFERRFDITLPNEPHANGEAETRTVRIRPSPADRCMIIFESADKSEVSLLGGDLYGHPDL
jgi:hypothetical protein